ncbi:MAG: Very short patch repair protein [Syntrophaceae bacterium PtaB.Bin095]|nr:MAG: Very short patch repair protein [Syntrophaceae bacterium PtaB.Bin095]
MSRVRGRDTKPEILVRSFVHRMGFRFRIHRRDLPGNPDIVLPRHGKVIFVHGCFWHGHKRCQRSKRPTTNKGFWNKKLDENIERDKRFQRKLRLMGWKVLVLWQCEVRKPEKMLRKLERFLHDE